MAHFELISHKGGDMQSRFYANGQRISRDKFESLEIQGGIIGGRVSCIWSKAKELPGGKFRRTEGKSVQWESGK